MLERREELSLLNESPYQVVVRVQSAADDLDGDSLRKMLLTFCQVHGSHSAAADLAHDAIGTYAEGQRRPRQSASGLVRRLKVGRERHSAGSEEQIVPLSRLQHRHHFGMETDVSTARRA
jgi:hypothetical protein